MKTAAQIIADAKARITEVPVDRLVEMLESTKPPILLDVRDQQEVNLGKIPGALHLSRGNLETKIEALVPRDANVVIYCASGNRSAFAADTLQQMGYNHVASLAGGFRAWAEAGGDVE
jgi:rhodanese-related sulfurtransferase